MFQIVNHYWVIREKCRRKLGSLILHSIGMTKETITQFLLEGSLEEDFRKMLSFLFDMTLRNSSPAFCSQISICVHGLLHFTQVNMSFPADLPGCHVVCWWSRPSFCRRTAEGIAKLLQWRRYLYRSGRCGGMMDKHTCSASSFQLACGVAVTSTLSLIPAWTAQANLGACL